MSSPSATGHDIYPERISAHQLRYFPDHIARYRFALQWVPGARVLDVPCGTGYGSGLLRAAGAAEVVGIDICPEAIAEARQEWPLSRLTFDVVDALKMSYEREFDLVTCFEGLEHVTDQHELVRRIARACRPDGTTIISTPNGVGGGSGNPFHVKELQPEELAEIANAHFRTVKFYYQRRNDPLDRPWSYGPVLKQLVPPALKRLIRPRAANQSGAPAPEPAPTPETTEAWLKPGVEDTWYPRSWNYLGYPGMEPDFNPHVIIVVCAHPR